MKNKDTFFARHKHLGWSALSLIIAIAVWQLISMTKGGGVVFAPPLEVLARAGEYAMNGMLWEHTGPSLMRVVSGFALGFVASIPMAFLIGWYKPFRLIVEPWIKFIKSIPPIAYIPLVVVGAGIGEKAKIVVIFIACFLTCVITIYQGVLNVDETLIKAAKVLGAKDTDMFIKVVVPASLPFIMTAMKLGLSASLTTLVAAEMTGAMTGLGTMIQSASQYFQMDIVLLGILVIGVMGMILQALVELLEKKLTGWQEKREI
ncbi:MAG: ABC transporter permease [Clostridia bacterium]